MEATEDAAMAPSSGAKMITKRDGSKQEFNKEKLLKRLKHFAYGLDEEHVTFDEVIEKVTSGIFEGKLSKIFQFNKFTHAYRCH